MSQISFSSHFYLYTGKQEKKSTYPIYCRITVNRKKAEFNTNKICKVSKWDSKKERVKGDPETSSYLTYLENEINSIHTRLVRENKPISAKKLKQLLLENEDGEARILIDYFDQFINEIAQLPEYTTPTIKKYKTIRKHLHSFLLEEKNEFLFIKDFNLKLINKFEFYLKSKSKLSVNTCTKYLKQLKALFNRALQYELIHSNPFSHYKFKSEVVHKTFLTKSELEQFEKINPKNESLEKVKDVFLFAVYTGLRYSDIAQLTPSNIKKEGRNSYWLDIPVTQKTKIPLRLPLLDKAIEIIKKYKKESEITGKVLPTISNQKTNSYLKILADLAGLDKDITFHVARHTFATTITLTNNVPLEVVSKMLGHTSINSTQIYAKITSEYLSSITKDLNKKLK